MWPEPRDGPDGYGFQEGSGETNRFEQRLGTVAGVNQDWSIGGGRPLNGEQGAGLGSRDQGRLPTGLPLDRVQGIFWTNESGPKFSL